MLEQSEILKKTPHLKRSLPTRTSSASKEAWLEHVREVISLEAKAIEKVLESVDEEFTRALELLSECQGKVILTGVGKSGLIARKIAATMSSTGTAATFLHPSDGMHGDLGILGNKDVVITLGKSGESEEIVAILPALRQLGAKIIAITNKKHSTLARAADVVLYAPVEKEACPHDLAPTVSTTMALVIGDALAMTLMRIKNFKPEDFAKYHPGGKLGKRLLLRVKDLMIPLESCATLDPAKATFADVVSALGKYGHGLVLFVADHNKLQGILTDGDIRRLLETHGPQIFTLRLVDHLVKNPITVESHRKAVEALELMEDRKRPLNVVPIVDGGNLLGVARLHDLLSVS